MGGIAIHYLAKTKLGIKTYENLSELHTQTDVPSCIKSVVIQSVITECVYFVITINMDEGVSKCAPSFFMHKAPTFTSRGFVIT